MIPETKISNIEEAMSHSIARQKSRYVVGGFGVLGFQVEIWPQEILELCRVYRMHMRGT